MKLFNWFNTKKTENLDSDSQKEQTYIDIIISLNKDCQIDFSIFVDDKTTDLPMSEDEYAILCGSFFNAILSNKMKKDAIDILNNQIKNSNNSKIINNIVSLISIATEKTNNNFIKPTEVFAKYIV